MVKVGVVGAAGYGGREFIRLAVAHPQIQLTALAGFSQAGQQLDTILPGFGKLCDLKIMAFNAADLAASCDIVVLAVPGKQSMALGQELHSAGVKVMDLGSDFRLKSTTAFKQYYGTAHACPELLTKSVYGLVPWYRELLPEAAIIAVPGCFPVSVITPLRPLVAKADPKVPVVVDSISGISGAGKNPNDVFHFPNMNENLKAYKLAIHQHTPEIEQEIGGQHMVQFTPHVAPITRGILTTITLRPSTSMDVAQLLSCYDKEPFVRVMPEGQIPDINQVRASNFCDMGWVADERTGNIIIVSAIDNLVGGTAGMGLQCLNVAFGLEETTGLQLPGMAP